MNLRIAILVFCLCPVAFAAAQSPAEQKFHESSNLFINGDNEGALASANIGLKQDPGHLKLTVLKKILEEQKKRDEQKKKQEEQKQKQEQQQQKKDQQNQEQKDKQKQEQEKKEKQEEQKKQEQQKSEQKDKDEENKAEPDEKNRRDDLPPEVKKRLEELDMPEEKAKMLLEAMRNQEIQYLQQDKRKATKKRTTRDNKPDW
jgi:outer membrane biosynthesis protein TonB